MNHALIFADTKLSAPFRYRCENFIEATKTSKKWQISCIIRDYEKAKQELVHSDLLIIERQTDKTGNAQKLINLAKKQGKKVIFSVDDLVFHPKYTALLTRSTGSRNPFYWFAYSYANFRLAKKADVFTTTNAFLAEKLQETFKKDAYVIPNFLNKKQVEISEKILESKQNNKNNFIIGYFSGTPTHARDFQLIQSEIFAFLDEHPTAKLKIVGYMNFDSKAKKYLKNKQIIFQKKVGYTELQKLISDVDVNIVPLKINDFTNSKSELKFFESAIVGTVTIASPTATFKTVIKDKENGFLCEEGNWKNTLEYIISRPKEIEKIASHAKDYALKNYYGKKIQQTIEQTYDRIMSNQPEKISVVVPNYNYGKYLKRRIETIIHQTYPIYELIIIDDCSTDNSNSIIEKEIEKLKNKANTKIKYIKTTKNSGKAIKQWKKAFKEAEGDYVWIAEADDLSDKHFLEKVMRGFKEPGVVISYSESAIINGKGLIIAPNFKWSRDKEKTGHYKTSYTKDGKDEIKDIMAIRCTIPNVSSAVFKKSDIPYEEILNEAEKYYQAGDWFFYTKVLENGKIHYNQKSLNYFRVHKGSVTNDSKKTIQHYEEILKIHKILTEKYDLSDITKQRMKNEEKRIKERI